MADYRRRLIVVLTLATGALLSVEWLAFRPAVMRFLAHEPAWLLALVLATASPFLFYPRNARYDEPCVAVALTLFATAVMAVACASIVSVMLNVDNRWVEGVAGLGQILIVIAAVILSFQAVRQSRAEKKQGKSADNQG